MSKVIHPFCSRVVISRKLITGEQQHGLHQLLPVWSALCTLALERGVEIAAAARQEG